MTENTSDTRETVRAYFSSSEAPSRPEVEEAMGLAFAEVNRLEDRF